MHAPDPVTSDAHAPVPAAGDALVVTDVQNDFVSGTLAVPGAAQIIDPLNRAIAAFRSRALPVIAIRDWHPPDHCSFASRGGPWPVHCVAGTPGAEYVRGLHLASPALLVGKGAERDAEAYSGFSGTTLARELRERRIARLFIGGLATDYCVLATVRDAIAEGFAAVVLSDGIRAVDVQEGDGTRAEQAMRALGARFATVDEVAGTAARPRASDA